jgi:hypothetical protein
MHPFRDSLQESEGYCAGFFSPGISRRPALKRIDRKRDSFRSAKALLPPHECGGSLRKARPTIHTLRGLPPEGEADDPHIAGTPSGRRGRRSTHCGGSLPKGKADDALISGAPSERQGRRSTHCGDSLRKARPTIHTLRGLPSERQGRRCTHFGGSLRKAKPTIHSLRGAPPKRERRAPDVYLVSSTTPLHLSAGQTT